MTEREKTAVETKPKRLRSLLLPCVGRVAPELPMGLLGMKDD